jgi:hypothetical protein
MEAPEEVVEREARDVATEEVADLVLPFQVHGRIRSGLVLSPLSVFSSPSLCVLSLVSPLYLVDEGAVCKAWRRTGCEPRRMSVACSGDAQRQAALLTPPHILV